MLRKKKLEERSYGQENREVFLKCLWTGSVSITEEPVINTELQPLPLCLSATESESLGLRPKSVCSKEPSV